jgi:hypothetical protein
MRRQLRFPQPGATAHSTGGAQGPPCPTVEEVGRDWVRLRITGRVYEPSTRQHTRATRSALESACKDKVRLGCTHKHVDLHRLGPHTRPSWPAWATCVQQQRDMTQDLSQLLEDYGPVVWLMCLVVVLTNSWRA